MIKDVLNRVDWFFDISKKVIIIGVVMSTSFLLYSCGSKSLTTNYSTAEISRVMVSTQQDFPEMIMLKFSNESFDQYVDAYYQLELKGLVDGVVYHPSSTIAHEVAVFLFQDESLAVSAGEVMNQYIENRANSFIGYLPEQAFIAEQGEVVQNGNYIALAISEDNDVMVDAFLECFGDNPPPLPSDMSSTVLGDVSAKQTPDPIVSNENYDRDEIITAYKQGDFSNLSTVNREIAQFCANIIDQEITSDMTDFEKEKAIYDWIFLWATYDEDQNNQSFFANPDPNNDNPYGLLFSKKAICYGYTETFQLFMDLLEVECITVDGTVETVDGNPHSWNKVKLDDEWYNVDLTWSDTSEEKGISYKYFNVTDEFMQETDHIWEYENYPEANGTEYIVY